MNATLYISDKTPIKVNDYKRIVWDDFNYTIIVGDNDIAWIVRRQEFIALRIDSEQ